MFGDYAYFSSFSDTWLDHVRRYCDTMRAQLALDSRSQVIEIASNDGYLLQYFAKAGVPVLGIEPARNIAAVAESRGIETWTRFFGVEAAGEIASRGRQADLLIANNVLAHVPAITDFVAGLAGAVKPTGLVTMEFPHLLRLMEENQFDTIYHEHFSYFARRAEDFRRARAGVVTWSNCHARRLSLRVHARRTDAAARHRRAWPRCWPRNRRRPESLDMRAVFSAGGETKRGFLQFLRDARGEASAWRPARPRQGNTLSAIAASARPHRVRSIAIRATGPAAARIRIRSSRPTGCAGGARLLVILPWNIKDEIVTQMADVRAAGTTVVPIPGRSSREVRVDAGGNACAGAAALVGQPRSPRASGARESWTHGLDPRMAQASTSFNAPRDARAYQRPPSTGPSSSGASARDLRFVLDLRPSSHYAPDAVELRPTIAPACSCPPDARTGSDARRRHRSAS